MPPKSRRPKRVTRNVLPPPNNPAPPLCLPSSAGTAVWNVVELRSRFIDLLDDPRDLSSMLRTEKRGMALVAGKLYRSKSYKFVRSRISVSAPRRKMYLDAISEIDARDMSLTPTMIKQLHLDSPSPTSVPADGSEADSDEDAESDSDVPSDDASDSDSESDSETTSSEEGPESQPEPHVRRHRAAQAQERVSKWLESYHPELLDILVPYLRKRCPGVEKIIMGAEYQPFGTGFWVVKLDRRDVPSAGISLTSGLSDTSAGAARGEVTRRGAVGAFSVDHISTLSFDCAHGSPPTAKDLATRTPQPHHESVVIRSRFDLLLTGRCSGSSTLPSTNKWRTALQESPVFGNGYKAADFGYLRVTFDLLSALYPRQIDMGHTDRLEHILAPKFNNWEPKSFRNFATIASTSLKQLILALPALGTTPNGPISHATQIPASHLPYLIHVVRTHLVSLSELAFSLGRAVIAEASCQEMLDNRTLARRGSISVLRVYMDRSTVVPFNTLRALSPLLSASFELIGVEAGRNSEQTQFIRYLRGQSPDRQSHLSAIHFPTLGVTTLADVSNLSYDADGYPQHILTTQLQPLLGRDRGLTPLISRGSIDQFANATRYIIERSEPPPKGVQYVPHPNISPTPYMLEQRRLQLDAILGIKHSAGITEEMLATAVRAEKEIREAIRVLKMTAAADLANIGV